MNATSNGYVDEVSELDWRMWMDYAGDQQRSPRDQRHACSNPECSALTEALYCCELCRQEVEGSEDHEMADDAAVLAVPALGEAPVSMNVHIPVCGRDVLVTLRGIDEMEVLRRLEQLLARYPAEQVSVQALHQHAHLPQAWRHAAQHQGEGLVLCEQIA